MISGPVRVVRARVTAVTLLALAAAVAVAASQVPSPSPPALDATVKVTFAPADHLRARVQGLVTVPVAEVQRNAYGFYNLEVTGDVLVDGRTYDHFAYRFDIPGDQQGDAPLVLSFTRTLRAGSFRLALAVHDVQSDRRASIEQALEVPRFEQPADPAPAAAVAPTAPPIASGPHVRLLPPPEVAVGKQRFEVDAQGEGIAAVRFSLDGHALVQRTAAPYSVELDLGRRPVHRVLTVDGLDGSGRVIASDRAELNISGSRFAVHLDRPGARDQQSGSFTAAVEVDAPPDATVQQVQLFLDDRSVAVLTAPPYRQPVSAPPGNPAVLRAVATLDDGTEAEDSVLLNAPASDEVHVDLVELYTAVVDHGGRPVRGLGAADFRVFEDGQAQRVERFAEVGDLPVHVTLAIDTSTSMTLRLADVKQAALAFLRDLVRPQDEAMLLTFDDSPHVRAGFTHDLAFLANGLEGLHAQGGTALYDSLVFALGQLQQVQGQRVLVLLSDGVDERSQRTAKEVMELARRGAVTLYTVGLEDDRPYAPKLDRELLDQLARETGGRSFYVHDRKQLAGVYADIQTEMRSRYLLAYYSSHAGKRDFRSVDVELSASHLQARTIRGYYPD